MNPQEEEESTAVLRHVGEPAECFDPEPEPDDMRGE